MGLLLGSVLLQSAVAAAWRSAGALVNAVGLYFHDRAWWENVRKDIATMGHRRLAG
jgi:uncharacterized membrane protein